MNTDDPCFQKAAAKALAEIEAHEKALGEALKTANLPNTFSLRRAADAGFRLAAQGTPLKTEKGQRCACQWVDDAQTRLRPCLAHQNWSESLSRNE